MKPKQIIPFILLLALFTNACNNNKAPKPAKCAVQDSVASKIYNLIILDESGSMDYLRESALEGANETILTIDSIYQEHPEQAQFLSFVSFSDTRGKRFRVLIDNKPISEVGQLTTDDYRPGGRTPLWDAMGYSLTKIEREVAEEDLVLVTIITDGYENASREYDGASIKTIVDRLSEKGWTFAYIGANQDAIEVAGHMGIDNAMNFKSDKEGTREMWRQERRSRARYYKQSRYGTAKERLKKGYFNEE